MSISHTPGPWLWRQGGYLIPEAQVSRREQFGCFSVSWCGDGLFDELVAERVDVHIERLDDGQIWFRISTKDDRRGSVEGTFYRKDGRKIDARLSSTATPNTPDMEKVKP